MLHCVTHLLPKEDVLLHRIWAHRDQIILVRPDRYVAASFSDESQSDILDKLRKVLNLKIAECFNFHRSTRISFRLFKVTNALNIKPMTPYSITLQS